MRKTLVGVTLGFLMVVASAAHAGGIRIGLHGPIVINGGGVTVAIGGGHPVMMPAPVVVPMYRVYQPRPRVIYVPEPAYYPAPVYIPRHRHHRHY